MERSGGWIQTYTGRKFWPLSPEPDDFRIEDIAHSLSLLCRFNGHCRTFYSVAQHSCLGALWASKLLNTNRKKLHFLLHDAAEAYITDIPRPLKRSGSFGDRYREIERELEREFASKFNLDFPMPDEVKFVDTCMLLTEKRDLLTRSEEEWTDTTKEFPPFDKHIVPWSSSVAESMFLGLYREYSSGKD